MRTTKKEETKTIGGKKNWVDTIKKDALIVVDKTLKQVDNVADGASRYTMCALFLGAGASFFGIFGIALVLTGFAVAFFVGTLVAMGTILMSIVPIVTFFLMGLTCAFIWTAFAVLFAAIPLLLARAVYVYSEPDHAPIKTEEQAELLKTYVAKGMKEMQTNMTDQIERVSSRVDNLVRDNRASFVSGYNSLKNAGLEKIGVCRSGTGTVSDSKTD